MTQSVTNVVFAPMLPAWLLAGLLALAAISIALSLWRQARGMWPRVLAMSVLALVLLNPLAVRESRQPLADIALLLVDDSLSQHIGKRSLQTEMALSELRAE